MPMFVNVYVECSECPRATTVQAEVVPKVDQQGDTFYGFDEPELPTSWSNSTTKGVLCDECLKPYWERDEKLQLTSKKARTEKPPPSNDST